MCDAAGVRLQPLAALLSSSDSATTHRRPEPADSAQSADESSGPPTLYVTESWPEIAACLLGDGAVGGDVSKGGPRGAADSATGRGGAYAGGAARAVGELGLWAQRVGQVRARLLLWLLMWLWLLLWLRLQLLLWLLQWFWL